MSIHPITIKITDKWKFGEVAFLVDREDFLEDVIRARKSLGINQLIPHTPEALNGWLEVEQQREIDKGFSKSSTKKFSFPVTKSQKVRDEILRKYRKSTFYLEIIKAAILCGLVTDDDFSVTSYVQIIDPEDFIERYKENRFLGYPKIAIIISPETKPEEVFELFKRSIPSEMDFFKKHYLKSTRELPDTISNIVRDRKWYWLHKSGLSYQKIWEQSSKLERGANKETVSKAVIQYKKLLNKET